MLAGPVWPMATLPLASIMNGVVSGEVLSSTRKLGPVPVLVRESLAHGVVEAMPTLPEEFKTITVPTSLRSKIVFVPAPERCVKKELRKPVSAMELNFG